MGKLIELDAALDALEGIDCSDGVGISTLKCDTVNDAITVIKALPTVDAVPVVHGHWIKFGVSDKDGNHQYRCSVCECEEIHSPLVKVSYCWNCGAKMDGKDGEGRE